MAFSDLFKGSENKRLIEENAALKAELDALKSRITPDILECVSIRDKIKEAEAQLSSVNSDISRKEQFKAELTEEIQRLNVAISQKQAEVVQLDQEILLQSFGLYTPQYEFSTAEGYKQKLAEIRDLQKQAIKEDRAVIGTTSWRVDGSESKGRKMVKDTQKLILRAFNSECDDMVSKVKYSNYETYCKRLQSTCDAITKLGKTMSIAITDYYLGLKKAELTLAFEYATKKQQEKEEQKEIRDRMREEARLQKEIDEQRHKLEKEQNHYNNALARLKAQIETASEEEKEALLEKQAELENQLVEIDKAVKDVDYREANKRAGYVYVISNIGAFGENVYKIGMTRRLDPMERVDELGDASVPFNFDVHAMIFSDDAPKLEAALHRAFEDKKVNFVNHRREFFNVTLDEVKKVILENYDKTVEWNDYAEAEQYRISLKMKEQYIAQ